MDKHCYFLVMKWLTFSPILGRMSFRIKTFQFNTEEAALSSFKVYRGFTGDRFDSVELWGPACLIGES